MACGLEARLPTAETRRLWHELKLLNETLSECVETAEAYLRGLDERVAATRAYFSEVKGRLAKVPTGKTVYREDVERLLKQDAEDTREHFQKMRNDAETGFEQVTRERSRWMDETTRLIARQMDVLNNIDIRALRHCETIRLRARIFKTFQDIVNVEGEVKNLQKVLYECEVGKAELEEDFIHLVKIFQRLDCEQLSYETQLQKLTAVMEDEKPESGAADPGRSPDTSL